MAGCRARTCCCCCSLRTGTITAAVFTIISAILDPITYIYALTSTGLLAEERNWFVPGFLASIASLVVSAVLLYGAIERKPGFLLPWVVVEIVCCICLRYVLAIAMFVEGAGTGSRVGPSVDGTLAVALGLEYVVAVSVSAYFVVVVTSYREELREYGADEGSDQGETGRDDEDEVIP